MNTTNEDREEQMSNAQIIKEPSLDELLAQAGKLATVGQRFAEMVNDLRVAILMARRAADEDQRCDDDDDEDDQSLDEWDDALSSCNTVQKAVGTVAKHLEILERRLRLAIPVNRPPRRRADAR
jgi:hypothetical protein